MRLGRTIFLLAGVLAVIVIVARVWHSDPAPKQEPVYQGKTLTRWLKQLDDGQCFGISSGTLPSPRRAQVEAAEAIRALGAEALPRLMQDIHSTPGTNSPPLKFWKRVNSLTQRVFGRWLWFPDVTEEDRIRWRAAQGLAALGPLARPAVPELRRLLYTNYFHSSIKEAAYALAAVGPEGIEILTNAVGPSTEWPGMCAIWALGQHPAAGTNVIPFLISATSSRSEGTACGAIEVLGLFHTDGERVIPVLTNALDNANPAVRSAAAWALGQFGTQAVSALPQLQRLATNNPAARANALRAIKKINR